jgi:predicted RecB family nuclease
MRVRSAVLTSSPTDLANFLTCRHKTALDLLVATGRIAKPEWEDPLANVLRERGQQHERTYIDSLAAGGLRIVDLTPPEATRLPDDEAVAKTLAAMRNGVDVIVQAPIGGNGWFGYADVLRRVEGPSLLGAWHYEVHDTKLARETRGGTILQLCVYSDVITSLQGRQPEHLVVVTPVAAERYRFDDFSAFYRLVAQAYRQFATLRLGQSEVEMPYPQPVGHCEICRWWPRCNATRRKDDHLSFVAGLGRRHQDELEGRDVPTLAALAGVPLPLAFVPGRGSRETYEKLREQARLQKAQREQGRPVHELLAIDQDFGLRLLPEPSPADLFLDFEGDPFARAGGREYLVGLARLDVDGQFRYDARWAFTDVEERTAFEWLIDEIRAAIASDPRAHVYHYAPYEPAAIKRLMTRYATREIEVDELLRGRRFVDLFAGVRQSLRAGVESYSIKKMEPFYGFSREIELGRAGDERRLVEVALETGDPATITEAIRQTVEGYNRDDCRSTLALRDWLEQLRSDLVSSGVALERPTQTEETASENVRERHQQIEALRLRLLSSTSPQPEACRLLAHLIDWHDREDKVVWWEYYRLCELPEEELVDEPAAVAGLVFQARVETVVSAKTGRPTGSVVDRYEYPLQEMEIRVGQRVFQRDGTGFGEVVDADRVARTLDLKKGRALVDVHATSCFTHDHVRSEVLQQSLFALGEFVASAGLDSALPDYRAGRDLLMRLPPRMRGSAAFPVLVPRARESAADLAVRIVSELDQTVLPVQGPPGAGKTFTGARMICELVRQKKRVGVTATGHKVIVNLLEAVRRAATDAGLTVRLGRKVGKDDDLGSGPIAGFDENETAIAALSDGTVDVLGGTAWLWASEAARQSVEVLFVDEAGQMSLANVLAVSPAAASLVLLGDPQQLEQPQKGSHPDGVGVSALEHVVGERQTITEEQGIFLPVTWRLAPEICHFTSAVFYESKLTTREGLEVQVISGSQRFSGAGLRVVQVDHDNCRNVSLEEVAAIDGIIDDLVASGVTWTNPQGECVQLTPKDILVVAPYNAQVVRLRERLDARRVAVGTVDKFQGQEAPVVIYSMTTSRPEDAPRGMTFLYNPNRLNVATSRAKCLCILVASPRLFEPDCQSPDQMKLANALCRYREMAHPIGATRRPGAPGAADVVA